MPPAKNIQETVMESVERQVIKNLFWRLVPLLMGLDILLYLDRVNVGFAALTMNVDVDLS
jgi:ACS family tartrate transporter-like MFS transporter